MSKNEITTPSAGSAGLILVIFVAMFMVFPDLLENPLIAYLIGPKHILMDLILGPVVLLLRIAELSFVVFEWSNWVLFGEGTYENLHTPDQGSLGFLVPFVGVILWLSLILIMGGMEE